MMFGFGRKKMLDRMKDKSNIMPRIKHTNFLVAAREMSVLPAEMPIAEPLVGDLLVAYAFDLQLVFGMVSAEDLQRLSLKTDDLRQIAISNLKKKLQHIRLEGRPPVLMLVTGDDLEACMLLMEDYWNHLSTEIPGGIVIAVPTRSIVLVTSRDSEIGLRVVREARDEARRTESTHALSDHLFQWVAGKWEVYE